MVSKIASVMLHVRYYGHLLLFIHPSYQQIILLGSRHWEIFTRMILTRFHFLLSIRCFDTMLSFILVHQSQKYYNFYVRRISWLFIQTLHTFIYRLCLTLPVTTCSAEQSFSKLKLTKTALRSTMGESRLSALLLLSIETDKVDLECIIDAFAALRQWRVPL